MNYDPDNPPFDIGQQFPAVMRWRLADNTVIWAGFMAVVKHIDIEQMRLLCQLASIEMLRTSIPPEQVHNAWLDKIRDLVGQYAFLPYEAASGTKLNLKLQTLAGDHRYFFSEEEYEERKDHPHKLPFWLE